MFTKRCNTCTVPVQLHTLHKSKSLGATISVASVALFCLSLTFVPLIETVSVLIVLSSHLTDEKANKKINNSRLSMIVREIGNRGTSHRRLMLVVLYQADYP